MISRLNHGIYKYCRKHLTSKKRTAAYLKNGIDYFTETYAKQKEKSFKRQGIPFEPQQLVPTDEQYNTIGKRLAKEIHRVYRFSNRAILEANIFRAGVLFWSTILPSLLFAVLGHFYSGATILTLLASILVTFPVWIMRITTTSTFYSLRIQGAVEATVAAYMSELCPELLNHLLINPSVRPTHITIEMSPFVGSDDENEMIIDATAVVTTVGQNNGSTTPSRLNRFNLFPVNSHSAVTTTADDQQTTRVTVAF